MKVRTAKDYKEVFRDLCNAGFQFQGEVADDVTKWHRAMQDYAFRFVLKVLRTLAAQMYYDGRNRHAVLMARELVKYYDNLTGMRM